MRIISNFSVIVGVVFLFACSEEPSAKVPSRSTPDPVVGVGTGEESTKFDTNAVVYEGIDFINGDTCNLKIGVVPHEDGEEAEEGHELAIQVEYKIHSLSASDSVGAFWRYNSSTGVKKYYDLDSSEPGADPVLISYVLNIERPDGLSELEILNNLEDYAKPENPDAKELRLKQYIRVDLSADTSSEDFAEAVEAVTEDPAKFEANKAILNKVTRVFGKLGHGDHADPVVCNYEDAASKVEKTSFDLEVPRPRP